MGFPRSAREVHPSVDIPLISSGRKEAIEKQIHLKVSQKTDGEHGGIPDQAHPTHCSRPREFAMSDGRSDIQAAQMRLKL
jgi:hypothetical protein